MKVALDTNSYAAWAKGEREIVTIIENAKAVYLPFVVLAEMKAGFRAGNQEEANIDRLRGFLKETGAEVLHSDNLVLARYVEIVQQLREQGTPIPTNDIWIAAVVLRHDLTLSTRDRHFEHLPQVPRI